MPEAMDSSIKQTWDDFVKKYTPAYIESMSSKDDYVIGRGRDNKSFCYLVEVELRFIGEMRGANSSKFGLWYGTFGNDKTKRYRATKKNFNGDVDKAFREIKVALSKLIRETKALKEYEELKSLISGMFKHKIMYLYNPEIMLPVFADKDIRYFESRLGLTPSATFQDSQRQLMVYKAEFWPNLSNYEFLSYLYKRFGRGEDIEIIDINDREDYLLNKLVVEEIDPNDGYQTHPAAKKEPIRSESGALIHPRDPKMALYALKLAGHKCELDPSHYCFPRRKDGRPYTEVHHLIPMCNYDDFDFSIDVPENIVSLCSSCHNEIHYGKHSADLIKKLFEKRKEKLSEAGIEITVDELLRYYHIDDGN